MIASTFAGEISSSAGLAMLARGKDLSMLPTGQTTLLEKNVQSAKEQDIATAKAAKNSLKVKTQLKSGEGQKFRITIPAIPPSVNHMYGFRYGEEKDGKRHRRVYLSKEAQDFKTLTQAEYNRLRASSKDVPYIGGKVKVVVTFHLHNNRNWDTGNHTKVVYDSLNGLAWQDDKYIVEEKLKKVYEPELKQEYTEIEWSKVDA